MSLYSVKIGKTIDEKARVVLFTISESSADGGVVALGPRVGWYVTEVYKWGTRGLFTTQ